VSVVELDRVAKRFGRTTVIDDLSLVVESGTILGVIGPSGSGKTTAVRLMTGAYRPDDGRARLFGNDASELGRRDRARIGYLPQLPVLSPGLSLRANIRFLASLNGASRRTRRRREPEVLELVKLSGEERTLARHASGGMQRRAALAGALLHDPELLFLDEPTAGIDPILRTELWEQFRHLRDVGHTLIITTQYVSEAVYCDRVALIAEGRLIAMGEPDELRRQATGGELVEISTPQPVPATVVAELLGRSEVDGVTVVDRRTVRVLTADPMAAHVAITEVLQALDVEATRVEDVDLTYDEVFVRLVERAATEAVPA
jgi:ABC-2 type transport system ATP-binding protein